VPELLVSVAVGKHWKDLVVSGDRVAHHRPGKDPIFSDPVPFTEMPIRYDRAYGGVDVRSDPTMPATYMRNHIGRGYVVCNTAEAVNGLELPNIEDPSDQLTPERLCCGHFMHWERQPLPDGLSWFAKYWQPRAGLAGVMPGDRALETRLRQAYTKAIAPEQLADYEKTRLPLMDFRFFNGASRGLALSSLVGDERLELHNLHPEGTFVTALPGDAPRIALDYGSGLRERDVAALHTVLIRVSDSEADLVWRAAFSYPGLDWLPSLRKLEVAIT
jgi:hypothetical protein